MIAAYIHTGAKVGVLVEVGAGKEALCQRRIQATGARHHLANRRRPIRIAVSREEIAADVDRQGKGNRRGTGQRQAAAGDREDRRRQAGEVLPDAIAWSTRAS